MLKIVPQEVWAFDVEWVPDPASGRRVYGLPASLDDDEVLVLGTVAVLDEGSADIAADKDFLPRSGEELTREGRGRGLTVGSGDRDHGGLQKTAGDLQFAVNGDVPT